MLLLVLSLDTESTIILLFSNIQSDSRNSLEQLRSWKFCGKSNHSLHA